MPVGRRLHVNLLIHAHTVGLRIDAQVWRGALKAADVDFTITTFRPRVSSRILRAARKTMGRLASKPPYDINIFAETIVESWCPLARVNVLAPHQEWIGEDMLPMMSRMDFAFCKTHYAMEIMERHGLKALFTGFTSVDRYDPGVGKDDGRFLHVAGSSIQKGTLAINEVWLKHPEWPPLTILSQRLLPGMSSASNITTQVGIVKDAALRRMQNAAGVHLCPSEAEGFGHYIVEAMSMASLVVTTDAPPMNEIIQPGRGLLAAYRSSAPGGMGTNYYVDPAALERTIDSILGMDHSARRALGENARAWFLSNDKAFVERLRLVLRQVGDS